MVIDEAHRLRNVYKPSNKIATAIKAAILERPKALLTATPLQNSLLELYGLVSIIDEFTLGDLRSFRSQFSRMNTPDDYLALRERIRPICQRTLRRQVLPYISYTNRHALVQGFTPSDDEQKLYTLVSDYLQSPRLYALPASQRQLMTLTGEEPVSGRVHMAEGPEISSWIGQDFITALSLDCHHAHQRICSLSKGILTDHCSVRPRPVGSYIY
jgi:hypothetical protein